VFVHALAMIGLVSPAQRYSVPFIDFVRPWSIFTVRRLLGADPKPGFVSDEKAGLVSSLETHVERHGTEGERTVRRPESRRPGAALDVGDGRLECHG
jgi:hypothetical protein